MRVLHNNMSDTAIITTPTAINSGQIGWLQDDLRGRKITFNATTADIIIDLGVAKTITAVAIADHSLGGSNTESVVVAGNAVLGAWGTATYVSPAELGLSGRVGIIYLNNTYRYWRIRLTSAVNISIGRIYLGSHAQSPRGIARGFSWQPIASNVRVISPGGQIHWSVGARRRQTNASIRGADPVALQAFINAVPDALCFIDLLPLDVNRGIDSRAWGDIRNIKMTEKNAFAADLDMEITGQ